jgi:predicted AAA+ superfamily ATPase
MSWKIPSIDGKIRINIFFIHTTMSYQRLTEISDDLISNTQIYTFIRQELLNALEPPNNNVSILKGARGIGKSTLMQQFLLQKQLTGSKVLYISADSTLLNLKLAEFAHEYNKRGGVYLGIDEIHKYPGWQAEVKTILDAFPQIKLVVSGSSSLNLDYASVDLSRRHVMLQAKGLSFREYINKNYQLNFDHCSLSKILTQAEELAVHITKLARQNKIDLLESFHSYLQSGYFISRNNYATDLIYYSSLINTVNSIIDADLSSVYKDIDNLSKQKIKVLLKHIAAKCPFTPNITELSKHLEIANDNTLKKYLYYLSKGEVLINLYASNKSHKDFQKPQKIFLNNTNFAYAFTSEPNIGTVRETFVANCLTGLGELTAPMSGDFCLDGQLTFEIGGRSKNNRQIKSVTNSYVFADNILSVTNNSLPLWLLGFLW